jgi:hypothetical protein
MDLTREPVDGLDDLIGFDVRLVVVCRELGADLVGALGGDEEDRALHGGQA